MFYHSILALGDVVQDGAPFFGAKGSFQNAKAMTRQMTIEEQNAVVPAPDMTRTKLGGYLHEMMRARGKEIFDPMVYDEVHWNEGVSGFACRLANRFVLCVRFHSELPSGPFDPGSDVYALRFFQWWRRASSLCIVHRTISRVSVRHHAGQLWHPGSLARPQRLCSCVQVPTRSTRGAATKHALVTRVEDARGHRASWRSCT
eukprot:SAG31_NODE_4442_length_3226_cov_3.664535_4_plen_202_part_00